MSPILIASWFFFFLILMDGYCQVPRPGSKKWSLIQERSQFLPCPSVHSPGGITTCPTWASSRSPTRQHTVPRHHIMSNTCLRANHGSLHYGQGQLPLFSFLHLNFSLWAPTEPHAYTKWNLLWGCARQEPPLHFIPTLSKQWCLRGIFHPSISTLHQAMLKKSSLN